MFHTKSLPGISVALVTAGLALFPVAASAQKKASVPPSPDRCESADVDCGEFLELDRLQQEPESEEGLMHEELARAQAGIEDENELLGEATLAEAEAEIAGLEATLAGQDAALAGAETSIRAAEDIAKNEDHDFFFYFNQDQSGWLGVDIAEVTPEKVKELKLPAERGVLVSVVEPDSPATKAGLKAHDVIQEFNGQKIEGTAQFRRLVRETPAGRTVQVVVWREGRAQTLATRLGSRRAQMDRKFEVPAPPAFNFMVPSPELGFGFGPASPRMGIHVEDLGGQLGQYFGAPEGEGVLVREVDAGSPAEKAGLKAGDVILKLDGERIKTAHDLLSKMREKREQKTASVGILRKGAEMSLNVEIEQPRPPQPMHITRRIVL